MSIEQVEAQAVTTQPSKVRRQHVPRWFMHALMRVIFCRFRPLTDFSAGSYLDWLSGADWGTTRIDGEDYFCAEPELPYPPPAEAIAQAAELAERINCRLLVLRESSRGAGTIRLLFKPTDDEPEWRRRKLPRLPLR